MTDMIRVALCGYGHHGQRAARILSTEHCIAAVCERDPAAAELARAAYPNARVVQHLAELDSDGIDLLCESSSLSGRRDAYDWCLRNDRPAVLDKPLALSPSGLCRFSGGAYSVYFRELYHPVIRAARSFLRDSQCVVRGAFFCRANTIGLEKAANPQYRPCVEGGAVLDKGIHDIANLLFLFGTFGAPPQLSRLSVTEARCWPACQGTHGDRGPAFERDCDFFVTLDFHVEQSPTRFPVTLTSSWIGINHDTIASLFDGALSDALWQSHLNDGLGPLHHCKVFAIDALVEGRPSLLIGSTLERDGTRPFLKLVGDSSSPLPLPAQEELESAYALAIRDALSPPKHYREWVFAVHRAAFRMQAAARASLSELKASQVAAG